MQISSSENLSKATKFSFLLKAAKHYKIKSFFPAQIKLKPKQM